MTVLTEYATFVNSRAKVMATPLEDLLHAGIGMAGESGEFLDALKKEWVYGKPLDTRNACEELGDCLFYIQMAAAMLNTTIDQLLYENMAKLRQRYPDGYSDAAAQARADKS